MQNYERKLRKIKKTIKNLVVVSISTKSQKNVNLNFYKIFHKFKFKKISI